MEKRKRKKLPVILAVIAALLAVSCLAVFVLRACGGAAQPTVTFNKAQRGPGPAKITAYPDAAFAVISDIHLYDASLGTEGAAFEEVLYSDRKLLRDSADLLDYAIDEIIASGVRFVLISGDLTKDGELACHTLAAEKFGKLTDNGINVYVVPGNHDVNNPDAESYSGDTASHVDSISADDFARIYADFGYGGAIRRDDESLSYVAEPADGLWLLAIDSCRYRENQPGQKEIVGGRINQDTADWIASVLADAEKMDKAVVAMMHHGVAEHWTGQSKLHPDYLVEGYSDFGEFLASYGARAVFTGHYHALDITRADFDGGYIYDIETGSLITAPCPIRYVSLKGGEMAVRSDVIAGKLRPGTDFEPEAAAFVKATVMKEAAATLKKYFVSDKDAAVIAGAVGDAFAAHYSGDEDPAQRPPLDESALSLWGRIVLSTQKYVLDGLWADLPPADVNVTLPLG